MSKNITVDPVKCVLLALFAGCFLISALALMTVGSRIAALLCLALAFVYLAGAAANAAVVHVDEQGISRRLLWFPQNHTAGTSCTRWAYLEQSCSTAGTPAKWVHCTSMYPKSP